MNSGSLSNYVFFLHFLFFPTSAFFSFFYSLLQKIQNAVLIVLLHANLTPLALNQCYPMYIQNAGAIWVHTHWKPNNGQNGDKLCKCCTLWNSEPFWQTTLSLWNFAKHTWGCAMIPVIFSCSLPKKQILQYISYCFSQNECWNMFVMLTGGFLAFYLVVHNGLTA